MKKSNKVWVKGTEIVEKGTPGATYITKNALNQRKSKVWVLNDQKLKKERGAIQLSRSSWYKRKDKIWVLNNERI